MIVKIREKGKMVRIASSIDIHRPIAEVFDFISSSANDFTWQYGTLASGRLSKGAPARGASFRSVGHLMGRRMVSTFEITEYERNRQYSFRSLTGPLVLHTRYTVKATPGSTRIRIVTQAVPGKGSASVGRGMEKYMQKELKDNLTRLKTILEDTRVAGRLM